ncbi:protein SPMIP2-like isoform X2 [Clavelina lepadiformis]|uniref:protein SPMIP2-like isoform X2 n=1 Tax=Clavelina lepadiformis TaxID=159417 RepID=UPI00404297E2
MPARSPGISKGPNGITNQRVHIEEEHRYVGIDTMSPEGTSEIAYLYRPDWRNAPAIRPKHKRVGEIGWGIPLHSDRSVLHTGQHIKRGEFRQSAEDRHTHLYQNPWTPLPKSFTRRPFSAPTSARQRPVVEDDYLLETRLERERPETGKDQDSASLSGSSHSGIRRPY